MRKAGLLVALSFGIQGLLNAEEYYLRDAAQMKRISAAVEPGDRIIIANGEWEDTEFLFVNLQGGSCKPITIRAEDPGRVLLNGESTFRLSGKHVIVKGLIFNDNSGQAEVFQFRMPGNQYAEHCRLTDFIFVAVKAKWATRNSSECPSMGKQIVRITAAL